jgi:sugar phosphate isomerase/epimerase
MKENNENSNSALKRRNFIKSAGIGITGIAAYGMSSSVIPAITDVPVPRTREERLKQISSNSYAVNQLFKRRTISGRQERPATLELKKKYGEITLLDFPQFTKDTYPGIATMDVWSSLFGDVTDDSMFIKVERGGQTRPGEFDPSSMSSKRYLDKLADNIVKTGIKAVHISNNAPRNIADNDEELRKEGIRVAKLWLDAAKMIGVKSMRVNTGGPQIIPASVIEGGYPRNVEVVPYIKNAIDSFRQMAEYGEKVGVKVTIENHWGLAANPINIRIIISEVNSPWCEASPDFCNWEHEYLLYHGLEVLMPVANSMIHAKRWTRYPDVDIPRCVKVLNDARYKGFISLEYEAGGDPVAGTMTLMNDVVDSLI